jgi:hypothetical protein
MRPALEAVLARGVIVVRASRTGGGRVLHEDNAAFPGTIGAGDLNPQKARVLLQLGLMLTSDRATIQGYVDRYLTLLRRLTSPKRRTRLDRGLPQGDADTITKPSIHAHPGERRESAASPALP